MIEYKNSGMKEYNDKRRKTIEDVKDFLISINCNTELLATEYINNRQKLKFRCSCGKIFERNFSAIQQCECGNLYNSNVGDFTTQYRIYCKECTKIQSNLEKIIKSELDNYNIKYIEQKRFDNCRSDITNYMLPFDFYLEDYNTIIEVDGEGHYKPINFHGISKEKSKQIYKRTIYNDEIKNKFCKNNNIKLIRIPYTEIKNNNYKNIIQTIIV